MGLKRKYVFCSSLGLPEKLATKLLKVPLKIISDLEIRVLDRVRMQIKSVKPLELSLLPIV